MKSIGVYIHIPFCIRKCNYCDFYSCSDNSPSLMHAYTEELCRRIKQFQEGFGRRRADTVYFGGGTPTLLPIQCFERFMYTLNDTFLIADDAEITVECNPATINKEGFEALRSLGVNRLSIGLQSADDGELRELGRVHNFSEFCESFAAAREAGFDNISVDLMYGIPNQTLQSFENTLREVCRLSPEHISAYGLRIEEHTAFARKKSLLTLPDEDTEYLMYCLCEEILKENGYNRYEISNFAKEGRESKHNLRYWQLEDYIGFGVAAHSCVDGKRFGNARHIKAFLHGEDITEECEEISPKEQLYEYVMLGLRLEKGIDLSEYEKLAGESFSQTFPQTEEMLRMGYFKEENGHISFTNKGFFVSNTILADMLIF